MVPNAENNIVAISNYGLNVTCSYCRPSYRFQSFSGPQRSNQRGRTGQQKGLSPRRFCISQCAHQASRYITYSRFFFFLIQHAHVFFFFLSLHLDGLHTTIPKGRKWFVFDNELVLPEYMICFEYLTGVSGSIGISSLFLSDPVINTIWIIECFQ